MGRVQAQQQPASGSAVVTGEAVALDLRAAALPSRLLAALLDLLAQGVLLVGLVAALAGTGAGGSAAAGEALGVLVIVVVLIGYPVAFETALRGRTPGKAALGLRAVRDDGGPIAFRQALVRGLVGAFVERPGVTLYLGAIVTSLLRADGKRLGDVLAGTLVVQERVPVRGGPVAAPPPQLADWAARLDLTGLPDGLAVQARDLLARSRELAPAAREELGGRLVRAVLERVSPPPPPGTPGWAVLSAVLFERRRRAEQRLGGAGGWAGPAPVGGYAPVGPGAAGEAGTAGPAAFGPAAADGVFGAAYGGSGASGGSVPPGTAPPTDAGFVVPS